MTVPFWTEDGLITRTEWFTHHARDEPDAARFRAWLAGEGDYIPAFRAWQAEQRAAPVPPQRDDPMPLDTSAHPGLSLIATIIARGD